MTEEDARTWIKARYGADGVAKMQRLADIVTDEATRQNLIAPSTLGSIWSRHIVDSAQLMGMPGILEQRGAWVDIGSGAGFPGLVIAGLIERPMWLVEPRKRRAAFLEAAAMEMGIADRVTVRCSKVEDVAIPAMVISARAVGYLGDLFDWAKGCASKETRWVLPKGRSAREEVESVTRTWHGVFHVEQSITDLESLIVLASKVARR